MKSLLAFVALLVVLSLATTAAFAKNCTIGIYAVIDQVTFEPDGPSANLVRISGLFVVPVPMSSGEYKTPQRGYLYFRIPSGMEVAIGKDWKALKAIVGTGQTVGFAQYWVPNANDPHGNPHRSLEVRVHKEGDAASPDVYPLPHPNRILKNGDKRDPDFDYIDAQLQKASRP